jgi:hypothetical protein
VVDERLTPHGTGTAQRLVSLSAIVTGRGPTSGQETFDPAAGGLTIDPPLDAGGPARRVVSVAWRPGDVEAASWTNTRGNRTVRLVLAANGWRRVTYASAFVETDGRARQFFGAERAWVAANPPPASESGEVAKRYTQSPQKRPSESSCGFESHLPQ